MVGGSLQSIPKSIAADWIHPSTAQHSRYSYFECYRKHTFSILLWCTGIQSQVKHWQIAVAMFHHLTLAWSLCHVLNNWSKVSFFFGGGGGGGGGGRGGSCHKLLLCLVTCSISPYRYHQNLMYAYEKARNLQANILLWVSDSVQLEPLEGFILTSLWKEGIRRLVLQIRMLGLQHHKMSQNVVALVPCYNFNVPSILLLATCLLYKYNC